MKRLFQLQTIGILVGIFLMTVAGISCKKSNSMTPTNATMTATVNGNQTTFTVTLSSSGGLTIVTGNSSKYTLTLVMGSMSAGVFTLSAQNTNYYATVTDNLGYSYSTDASNTGQITLTQNGGRFNGTFYFNANETSPTPGGANVSVTNGSCTNI